jgi:hypothetical protein
VSTAFGWLDQDDAQRAAMNEIVRMFQDQGSVDELGIGAIRDAFSNSFFPGTSVLHTRVRYLLFLPWLVAEASRKASSSEMARSELRRQEVRLIRALLAGDERAGVIGSQAQERLKTMPSQIYWPVLQRFEILRWDLGIEAHLRRACDNARRGIEVTEADAADGAGIDLGVDPELPPRPAELLSKTTFRLSPDEAGYLQGAFARLPESSLMHWLAAQPGAATGDWIWTSPAMAHLPDTLLGQVDHARRLHHAWYGAPLVYNLMLAELVKDQDLVDAYQVELADWESELGQRRVFDGWSQPEFWTLIRELNPGLRRPTQIFVSTWLDLAEAGEYASDRARDLIRQREIFLKGRRSRLLDAQARESWTPGAGTGRLGFRWGIASSFLRDVQAGLADADDRTVVA